MNHSKRNKATGTAWTEAETFKLVCLYNHMLRLQQSGKLGAKRSAGQVSKAVLVRQFIEEHAPSRTKGSVECKLMNVSHCRAVAGLPLVDGYKALSNVSSDLVDLFAGMAKGGDA